MLSVSSEPVPNILLVTSQENVSNSLERSFGESFELLAVEDSLSAIEEVLKTGLPDMVLLVRETIDEIYLESLTKVLEPSPLPILVFVQSDPQRTARAAIRLGITSFVVDEFEAARIPTLIDVTLERFKQSQSLREELVKSQEELAARKIIDRAKGLLMDRKQMTEQEAYKALRELAMRQAKPIREVAETLLTYSEVLP